MHYNYSAGPSSLFPEVVETIKAELGNWNNTHCSIMEISHRSSEFMDLYHSMQVYLRLLLGIPDTYEVLFMHGGARGQFAAIPLNMEKEYGKALYLNSGHWSRQAATEAKKFTEVIERNLLDKTGHELDIDNWYDLTSEVDYVHFCANETCDGIEIFNKVPVASHARVVADFSSTILSRPIKVSDFDVIYAGAQKNIGCAGLTIVIVKKELLNHTNPICPDILDWTKAAKVESMLNTPATFSWYSCNLTFMHLLKEFGDLTTLEQRNITKASKLYAYIDNSKFYTNRVVPKHRSRMNVVFQTPAADLDTLFVKEATKQGLRGLKGHKVVGGLRASIYNAIGLEAVDALIEFMTNFENQHKNDPLAKL